MNIWMSPKLLPYAPYLMGFHWLLAFFALSQLDVTSPDLLFAWLFLNFLALLGAFAGLMMLWIDRAAHERNPHLRRVLLTMMGIGVVFLWAGVFVHLASASG